MSWLLPRLVGWRVATDILLRGRTICAEEALDLGLVDAIVDRKDLLDRALQRAEEFARLPPLAVRTTKQLLRAAGVSSLQDQLERECSIQMRLFATTDATRGDECAGGAPTARIQWSLTLPLPSLWTTADTTYRLEQLKRSSAGPNSCRSAI